MSEEDAAVWICNCSCPCAVPVAAGSEVCRLCRDGEHATVCAIEGENT